MSEKKYTIRFLDVPKEPNGLREALHAKNPLTHSSKKLSIEEADQAVMNAARKLDPNQRIDITLEIKEKSKEYTDNWKIRPILSSKLADDGLYSLLVPLLKTDDSKELRDLLNSISTKLAEVEQKEQENSDDDDPYMWHDQEQEDDENYYEDNDSESYEPQNEDYYENDNLKNRNEEENDENVTRPITGVVPQEAQQNNEYKDVEREPERSSSKDEGIVDDQEISRMFLSAQHNSPTKLSNSDDNVSRKQHETVKDYSPILIPAAQFTDVDDVFSQIPAKYEGDAFDLNTILKNLGYVDSPKNDYERSLNLALQEKADELHLNKLQTGYSKKLTKLKQDLVKNLGDYYHQINNQTVALAVNDKCREKLDQLEKEATEKKNKYIQDGQVQKKKKLDEIDAENKEKLAAYQAQLDREKQEKVKKYDVEVDTEVSSKKAYVDQEFAENSKKIRVQEQEKEIEDRNNQLNHEKFTKSQDFLSALDKTYDKYAKFYTDNLEILKKFAKNENDRIQKQKNTDLRLKEAKKQAEAEMLERKRANDLKEKEIEKQADLPKDMAAAIASALKQNTQAASYGNPNQVPYPYPPAPAYYMPPVQQQPQASQVDADTATQIKDLQKEIDRLRKQAEQKKHDDEIDSLKEELKKERAKNEASSKKSLVAKASGLAAIMALGLGSFGYFAYQNNQSQNASQSQSQAVLNKASLRRYNTNRQPKTNTQSDAKRNSTDNKNSDDDTSHTEDHSVQKSTNTVKAAVETDNNLKNYQNSKSWQQKVDALNAMLGQHDIRALKEVNDSDPSKISKLYTAITMKNDADMRRIYLSMNPNERKDLSWSARNDVALAFYNVKDWHNGWYIRYGDNQQ